MSRSLGSGARALEFISKAINAKELLTDLVALVAVLVVVIWPGGAIGGWLLVIASLVTLIPALTGIFSDLRHPGGVRDLEIGTLVMARVLVTVSAIQWAVHHQGGWWILIAGVFIGLLTLAELGIHKPVKSAMPQVANFENWTVLLPSRGRANSTHYLNTAAVVILAVSALSGLSAIWATLLALGAMVLTGLTTLEAVRFLRGKRAWESGMGKALDRLAPVFAFHWQAPAGTAYQAAMWLPYLDKLGVPYFVLVRTAANFHEVVKLTNAPVILRSGLEDLDPIVRPSLKVVFYANTAVRNSHMIRFPSLTHIQLNHGDSDKIASVSPTFRQYDKNFVAGRAAIDRFAKHGVTTLPEQFEIVGRPQLEHVAPARAAIADIEHPTVLYSPTWSGFYDDSDYSSLSAGEQIVAALLERGATVVFRPHPYARRHPGNAAACAAIIDLLSQDAAATGREHCYGPQAETEMSVVDCFNAADAMISDVSSVVSDFLISGKPFVMSAVSAHGEAFLEEFPLGEAGYLIDVHGTHVEGLAAALDALLGADPKAETRNRLRTYYLGEATPEECVAHFVSKARQFLVDPEPVG